MPKFSVIIPVYNVAPYLRECLDSVVAAVVCLINLYMVIILVEEVYEFCDCC